MHQLYIRSLSLAGPLAHTLASPTTTLTHNTRDTTTRVPSLIQLLPARAPKNARNLVCNEACSTPAPPDHTPASRARSPRANTTNLCREAWSAPPHTPFSRAHSPSATMATAARGGASLGARFRAFVNSETGPRTTHFWGPVANWGFVLAGLADAQKPAEFVSPNMTGS